MLRASDTCVIYAPTPLIFRLFPRTWISAVYPFSHGGGRGVQMLGKLLHANALFAAADPFSVAKHWLINYPA